MDALDINWCLTCNRHIDSDANSPYCSRECFSSDQPSLFYPSPSPFRSPAESVSEFDIDQEPLSSYHEDMDTAEQSAGSAWIGRGEEGIQAWARDVTPGAPCDADQQYSMSALRPPKLLLTHRRPVPPTLCMSETVLTPAAPSRPILAPRQSLPSLTTFSATNTSMASLTTPSSSLSVVTPASELEPDFGALAHPHGSTLMHKLTAHFRSWAAAAAQKDFPRSSTVTRHLDRAARDESALRGTCLFLTDDDIRYAKASAPESFVEKGEWPCSRTPSTQLTGPDDERPVFRARGRKMVPRYAS